FLLLSFFDSSADLPDLHPFPTRRSSDLRLVPAGGDLWELWYVLPGHDGEHAGHVRDRQADAPLGVRRRLRRAGVRLVAPARRRRSEEHTSELQSRVDLVCRLLLEKKKKL